MSEEIHGKGSGKKSGKRADTENSGIESAKKIVTRQRVEKVLYKLADEGIIAENFSLRDMREILQYLPSEVYYDCLREEPKAVNQIVNFGMYSRSIATALVREIVAEKEKKNE